jgi:hypothetical protein
MISRLPDNCNVLYSDLQQKVLDSIFIQTGGSFVSKTIKGVVYWYFQTPQVSGRRKQICIGRETPEVLSRVESARNTKADAAGVIEERKRLVAMLSVGGATVEKGRPAKIIDSMSSAGLFDAGGVLVGSFAFACYGNMLGVSFDSVLSRTEDMDFSVTRDIQIGVPRNIGDDLRRVDPSLKSPQQLLPSSVLFELIASDGFKVEFLTTRETVTDKSTVLIEQLSVYAQPLEYMDYLIENSQQAVVLHGAGISVRVPDPARFALHKLAVSQLRPASMKTKADKDLRQAGAILEVLLEDNPGLVMLAADVINGRDDLLASIVRKGAMLLPDNARDEITGMIAETR